MNAPADQSETLCEAVRRSAATGEALHIGGSASKAFLSSADPDRGRWLSVAEHRGVLDYAPEELVITARTGTPLREIEQVLAESAQYLPFEPPRLHGGGTLGGAVACGLAGPGRPWRGAVRDAVLGVELINGRGECLRFGGQVMKNVAGYDVARLQAGAFGTLGLLLALSVKVLPRPHVEHTVVFALSAAEALRCCRDWARRPHPISATCIHDGRLWVRLSGAEAAVAAAARRLGGDTADGAFWESLRDQRLDFFAAPGLWRASLPPATAVTALGAGDGLITWSGAERWWRPADPDPQRIAAAARTLGGHARPYDGSFGQRDGPWLAAAEADLGRRLRAAFDPHGVFNPALGTAAETFDAD